MDVHTITGLGGKYFNEIPRQASPPLPEDLVMNYLHDHFKYGLPSPRLCAKDTDYMSDAVY